MKVTSIQDKDGLDCYINYAHVVGDNDMFITETLNYKTSKT